MTRATYRLFLLFWLVCCTGLAHALTLGQYMKAFDYDSMQWAFGLALFASIGRTLATLSADRWLVHSSFREFIADAITGLLAGGTMFLLIEGIAPTFWPSMEPSLRMVAVFIAAGSRALFFGSLNSFVRRSVDAAGDRVSTVVRGTTDTTIPEGPGAAP